MEQAPSVTALEAQIGRSDSLMEKLPAGAPQGEPDNVTPGWTTTPAGYLVPADLDDDPRLWTGEPVEQPMDW